MKQYYAKVVNGVIRTLYKKEDFKGDPIKQKLELLTLDDDIKVCVGFSTYIDGVFSLNKELADNFNQNTNLKVQYRQELKEIQKWLADNDWKVNKVVIGEWTIEDKRWVDYINERTQKRNRQDELNNLLYNIKD